MQIENRSTALVFIDSQNDALSPTGANWEVFKDSVTENRTVENMSLLFRCAKDNGYEVLISPHYFYPHDSGWKFNGPLEAAEFDSVLSHVQVSLN